MSAATKTITIKLFASLAAFLPPGASGQQAALMVTASSTVGDVIEQLKLPADKCHLVLVDGVFIPPPKRASEPLPAGAVLAIWPMVAGG